MNQSNPYIKNLNRIEFVVTMACTGHCKHCSEGDHRFHTGHIDADVAADAIREICAQYRIASLMTFGGEPLIYPEVICQIHRTATEMGIPRREVITNGFFSKDKSESERLPSRWQVAVCGKFFYPWMLFIRKQSL